MTSGSRAGLTGNGVLREKGHTSRFSSGSEHLERQRNHLHDRIEQVMAPLTRFLTRMGATANQVTVAGVCTALAAAGPGDRRPIVAGRVGLAVCRNSRSVGRRPGTASARGRRVRRVLRFDPRPRLGGGHPHRHRLSLRCPGRTDHGRPCGGSAVGLATRKLYPRPCRGHGGAMRGRTGDQGRTGAARIGGLCADLLKPVVLVLVLATAYTVGQRIHHVHRTLAGKF